MANKLVKDILLYVDKYCEVNSLNLVNVFNEDHQKIIGAIKSLQTLDNVINVEQITEKKWELTAEGKHVVEHGSHEAAIYYAIPENGILQSELMKIVPYSKIGFSKALAAGWIQIEKLKDKSIIKKKVESINDSTLTDLNNINNLSDNIRAEYRKRKLLQEIIIKSILVKKGPNFVIEIGKQEADLTSDLLTNDAWKKKEFKLYNFDAMGSALDIGHLHPLLKVRAEFRKIFLEMGFTEMPTNNFIESSFWNFDALFQPQQHPARDAHDTFFISDPKFSINFPNEYLNKVKDVHSRGGYGSQGYGYDWKETEAQKNLLRTHTTAVSARMLYKLMQQDEFKPIRYFSIDRVFRNETLDATHLAEFHQVEGVIADYNLTLGDLIGTLHEFFRKFGITKLEFKPAYNPYTEPSMEIFCFHEGLGKWIEIGNSGVFRPEMLLPMGIPENVNVIAWGLSVERPTMIKYKFNNIRDLVGPKVNLQMVYDNPICRLEKVNDTSISNKKLLGITSLDNCSLIESTGKYSESFDIQKIKHHKYIILCDPMYPILWLESLLALGRAYFSLSISCYVHSSVSIFPKKLMDFCQEFKKISAPDIQIIFIWKNIGIHPILKIVRMEEIIGEVNIARYFNRIFEHINCPLFKYEDEGSKYANEIDTALDSIHIFLHTNDKLISRNFYQKSEKPYISETSSIVDKISEMYSFELVEKKK